MLKGKNIVLGVTGGIAAYKSADLVSRLVKKGANVDVIMTEGASKFVCPLTFQTMSNNPVYKDMFENVKNFDVEHISLAKKADRIIVAPATANIIGKIANGIADNLLTTVIMASRAKIIFAPAMNTEMYRNPIVEDNMDKLKKLAYEFIDPGTGLLACKDIGAGKMAEPADIVEYLNDSFIDKDLLGKKVVITAGPTIEAIDPVRFISNHSSGKMGYSLAREAVSRGGEVILISGPTSLEIPKGVKLVEINSTRDMFDALGQYFYDCDIVIKSAAPADYRPESYSDQKIKKSLKGDDTLDIKMVRNPDIAHYYGARKTKQTIVGFAAETNDVIKHASEKLKRKNFDLIVANDLTQEGAGFKTDTNIVTIIDKDKNVEAYPLMEKSALAKIILDRIVNFRNKS